MKKILALLLGFSLTTNSLYANVGFHSKAEVEEKEQTISEIYKRMNRPIQNWITNISHQARVPYIQSAKLEYPLKYALGFYGNSDPAFVMDVVSELNTQITAEEFAQTRNSVVSMIGLHKVLKDKLVEECGEYKSMWKQDSLNTNKELRFTLKPYQKRICEKFAGVNFDV